MALCLIGCSSQVSVNQAAAAQSPQTYVGLAAAGSSAALDTFVIDRTADTLVQDGYEAGDGYEQYVSASGTFAVLPSGILNIGVTFGNGTVSAFSTGGTFYNPPQTGNWALEWPGQGGFAGLLGQTVVPFTPNQTCPSLTTPETFQFVSFPIAGDGAGTAYGSVSIGTSGGTVNFTNVSQSNVSGGASSNPSTATVTGTCGPAVYGHTISVPDTVTLTDPGSGQETPSATIAIGPSGFLVEDNGFQAKTATYQNLLGAGVGAVGLPQPSSPLTVSALVGAKYTGFIYGTGSASIGNFTRVASTSLIASFGYPAQTACPTLPSAGTIIYGGEFANNDPSSNAYGRCDFAVDLGVQDAKNNGLFPNAKVWVGSSFPGNNLLGTNTGGTYFFSAVAIAGQLQGKYAIFLIGLDTTGLKTISQGQQSQDWGIYLLQSN
jgi:hypothetical protein